MMRFVAAIRGLLLIGTATIAVAAMAETPGFWDPRHRPETVALPADTRLRIVTADDYPPFNFTGPDGVPQGFNIDMARETCRELGVSCTIEIRPWSELVPALESGAADIIAASLRPTAEMRRRVAFSTPYQRTPARFVVRRDDPGPDLSPSALAGKRVAVEAGSAHEAYLAAAFPGVVRLPQPDAAAARAALRDGKADLLFGDGASLAFWLVGENAGRCCRFVGGPYLEARYFGEAIGFAVHRDDPLLRQAIDQALFAIWERGVYADVVRRWFPLSPYGAGP